MCIGTSGIRLQAKCGLTVDHGEKNTEGTPTTAHRYSFHMLRHAAASRFINYLGWTAKRPQRSWAFVNTTLDLLWYLFEDTIAPTWRKPKLRASRLDATRLQHAGQFGS